MLAIANHVDHHIAMKGFTIVVSELSNAEARFGVVAVHMKNRCLNRLRHVCAVRGATSRVGVGSKTNLIVDNEVDGATCFVSGKLGKLQGFRNDTLTREGRITVHEERQYGVISHDPRTVQLRPDHSLDYRVNGL